MMKRSKFDPVEGVMRKSSIMLLIVSVFIVFGIYSLINMPKNEFPTFTVRTGVVAAVYPGATSAEVEEQVTKPLEKFLWGFKEIKKAKTYSESKDGVCYVFVELNAVLIIINLLGFGINIERINLNQFFRLLVVFKLIIIELWQATTTIFIMF